MVGNKWSRSGNENLKWLLIQLKFGSEYKVNGCILKVYLLVQKILDNRLVREIKVGHGMSMHYPMPYQKFRIKISVPVISLGSRSGVNCMR